MSAHNVSRGHVVLSPILVASLLMLSACGGGGSGGGGSGGYPSPMDTTPPTVALNAPGGTLSGTVALTATATDDRGVTLVEFVLDGALLGSDTVAPYSFDWNTGTAVDGTHSLLVRARDAAGNSATTAVATLTVQNSLTFNVTLTPGEELPATPSLASGTATLSINVASGSVRGTLTLSGITATAAHIHDGPAGQNGPVIVGLTESATTPGVWDIPANAVLTAAQVQKLLSGGLYLNAHSGTYPGGEIRGQITPPNIDVAIARLDGLQQVPAVESAADAQGGVTVNRAAGRATIHLVVRNLANPTAAHLHEGYGGRNGAVLIGLTQDGSDPTHWFAVDQPISQAAIDAFLSGATYLNVHTQSNPNGEIRGQAATSDVQVVVSRLTGEQEVPARTSNGRGTVAVTVRRSSRDVVAHANVTGIDDATGAHIHEAYAGTNGGIIVPLTKDPSDATHWSATGATLATGQFDSLQSGKLYVNVHTPAYPGGEIRGQLVPASVRVINTGLSGNEEVPPVTSAGGGTAATTVDLAARTVSIHVRTSGLDDATASHIHRAARGTNGPVIVPLVKDASNASHWSAEAQSVSDAQLEDFKAFLWYVNVHTPAHPSGEIRGQIGLEPLTAPDTEAPTVALGTLPASVSGTVTLSATANDNVGVAVVRFRANGALIAATTTAPYTVSWNTTAVANGPVTLTAEADDTAGNVGQSVGVLVTVDNPPAPVPDTTPPSVALGPLATTLTGTVTLSATATDNVGVTVVRFRANGNLVGTSAAAPYAVEWDTTTVANGSVTITAEAQDAAGNVAQTAGMMVTVDNPPVPVPDTLPPTVALAPLPAVVSGIVTLSATATDNVGVVLVRFLLNGNLLGSDATAPYELGWNTTTTANGPASVSAEAVDAAGNVGATAAQAVTVDNAVVTTLSQLQATIFTPRCSGCHTGGGGFLPSSMNLSSAAASWAALVGVASEEQPALLRVQPNDPAASYLVRKLDGGPGITGVRMPFGGPYLSASDMDMVRSWINSGAPNN